MQTWQMCYAPQVLPQLLNWLGLDDEDPSSPDWGSIAVYTCSASCTLPTGGSQYAREFVYVQPS